MMNGCGSISNVVIIMQSRCFSPIVNIMGNFKVLLHKVGHFSVEKQKTLPYGPSWCRSCLNQSDHRQEHMH